MKKRSLALLLAAVFLLTALPCALAEGAVLPVWGIAKYGNLILEITGADFMALGFDYGDVLSVEICGTEWEMPVCSDYSEVDTGSPVCRVETMEEAVVLALNMADLASTAGLAVKTEIAGEPGYRWDYSEAFAAAPQVTVSLKEARGYYDQWLLRSLVHSDVREDYAHLDDAAFANFRMVDTAGMGEGRLYRSSSPVNPEMGRSSYAMEALEAACVKTVINLADDVLTYEGWQKSAYAGCEIICLNMGVDFSAFDFEVRLAEGLRFMLANEGPYLVHCTQGKDRAGFVSAVLECLMGAPAEEVTADYMETYYNYFGVQPGTEQYEAIAESNIEKSLAAAFDVADIYAVDLAAEAADYLRTLTLNDEEIAALKQKLG